MKGIVFTEFFDMVESRFGANMVDDIIDDCDLDNKGGYTSVGTYNHVELLALVGALGQKTNTSVKDLVHVYGHHLFFRFQALMPQFFEDRTNAFDFLKSVHNYIHVEVKKIYPDAQLPEFSTHMLDERSLVMTYVSKCPFADFASGLISGCIDFYKENIVVTCEDKNTDSHYSRIFLLIKQ
jgi:hypothetical protein